MNLFHRCVWKERERVVVQPMTFESFRVSKCSEEQANRIMFGMTTIVLACVECGDYKAVEVIGSVKP